MGLVVTVDGSWEISDSFLVTSWYNNEMRRIWDKRDVIFTRSHLKKHLELAYVCEKWTLSENCNN